VGRSGIYIGFLLAIQKKRDHYEDQDVASWTILKWSLEREDGAVWTGSIWLRIATRGGLL
jgi:hypothetical protein